MAFGCTSLALAACSGDIGYPDGRTGPVGQAAPTVGTAASTDGGAATAGGAEPDGPLDGATLYGINCARCHGAAGVGTDIAPEIQHPPADYFAWVVRHGLEGAFDPPMSPFDEVSLDDRKLQAIFEYLTQLPQPTTEAGLYADYCANCHGADARGGVAHKTIAGKDEFLEVLRQGKGGTDYAARTRYMPNFGSSVLDGEVVSELEHYVGALPE